jgi:hypothetical protein
MYNFKFFIKPLLNSLKNGFIVFLALLSSFGIFEYIQSIIHGRPTVMLDMIDFAIATLGFLLVFAGKFLERLYGKN